MKKNQQDFSSIDTKSVVFYLLDSRKVLNFSCLEIFFLIRRFVPSEFVNQALSKLSYLVASTLFHIKSRKKHFVVFASDYMKVFEPTCTISLAVVDDKVFPFLSDFQDVCDHLLVIVSSEIHDLYYSYYKMEA